MQTTERPTLYLIGGPNGSGKTTFCKEYLPNEANCLKFLNSDEIAKGLSPFDSSAGQLQAGRILLKNLRNYLQQGITFALESTLSGQTYIKYLKQAIELGYKIELHFLWLPSADESNQRVKQRVLEGGHHVPEIDIHRRYPRIMKLIFSEFLPLAHKWYFWDASKIPLELLTDSSKLSITELKQQYGNQ